jgi:hypothetical protein
MRDARFLVFVILFAVLPHLLTGQENSNGQTFLARSSTDYLGSGLSRGLSLLDPSRFSMSHSYTVSFTSSGGEGHMMGLYMNTMNYQFSDPLSVTVHVGYRHQPFAPANTRQLEDATGVLSGFELEYRPAKNFFLKIEYGATPYLSNPYFRNRYQNGW